MLGAAAESAGNSLEVRPKLRDEGSEESLMKERLPGHAVDAEALA